MTLNIRNIRNVGIAAHIDAGKTTTTERILFYTGVLYKLGEVHEGTATTDWMEQERERGITITAAAISCSWKSKSCLFPNITHNINIIDTPGHVDFTAEVERSLRVLDGVIGVFCSVAGVQPQSETVWRQMDRYKVPRLVFINKMDRLGADFYKALEDIKSKLDKNTYPLYLPVGQEDSFTGLIDLVSKKMYVYDDLMGIHFYEKEIPKDYIQKFNFYREQLIEYIANFDDKIADIYLNEDHSSIEPLMLKTAIRKLTSSLKFIGAIPGSSFKNKGVQMLLDSIVDYLPSPIESIPVKTFSESEDEFIVNPLDSSVVGIVFKIWSDSFVGKLVFFRLYSGELKKGMILYNPRTKKTEKINRILLMRANSKEDVDVVLPGNICALVGLKNVSTGDTLLSDVRDFVLEPPVFPEPVISMYIEPKTKSDQEKLALSLKKLSEEDPTFKVNYNLETGQTLISGMGELHLEIIKDRLTRDFKINAISGQPQIAYKETITKSASGEGKYIKQSGGRGQYGHVIIDLKPRERGSGINILNKVVGGSIPKEFIKSIILGLKDSLKEGFLKNYPITDLDIYIKDGSFHEVDSSEFAFKMAASLSLKDALAKAESILLEPIMKVDVITPEEYQGDIINDIIKKRGIIDKVLFEKNFINVKALLPLKELFGYSTHIRSLSKGRASYSMTPSHFEKVINI